MQQGTESKPIIPAAAEICDINALSTLHIIYCVFERVCEAVTCSNVVVHVDK